MTRRPAGAETLPTEYPLGVYTRRMEHATAAHAHDHHHHGPLPTSGRALDLVAFSATLHCLTGCAIGEIVGMVVGTALGFSDWATVGLAVVFAFMFGYTLTSWPLLRAGFAFAAVVPIALATDTVSIAVMEIVDNAIIVLVPGALEAELADLLFWGSLAVALVIAGVAAFPVNRRLIARGKGHAVLHETGIHGGPSPQTVGAIAAVAGIFGTAVLLAEVLDEDDFHSAGGWLALALYALYMALAFGLRTWIQVRRTGESGFKGISGRPGSLEWIAGVLFVVAIGVGVAAPVLDVLDVLEPLDALDSAGVRSTGIAIFLAGLLGTLYAQIAMGESWRVGVDEQERTALVTSGPFAVIRNPIFAGMLPASLGLALLVPNVVALAGLAALFIALEIQVRLVEEPHLLRAHGDSYRQYAARVGRFVPGLGRLDA
jgi:protein-S-isoprenylcysteine O-methyltransferase Ste14